MRIEFRRSLSRHRATIVIALAPLLAAADCFNGPPDPQSAYGTAVITVVSSSGVGIGGGRVVVTELAAAGITDENGRVTMLVRAGTRSFLAFYIGCQPARVDLSVPAGGTVSGTIAVGCGDAVHDVASPTASRTWTLSVGSEASGSALCGWERPFSATGLRTLGFNARSTGAAGVPCDLVSFVMGSDRAPGYTSDPTIIGWTDGLGDIHEPTLAASRLPVPIRIIVSDSDLAEIDQDAFENVIRESELKLLTMALDLSRAGIELVDEAGGQPKITFDASPGSVSTLAGGCGNAAAIRAEPALYSRGRINVYYVSSVTSEFGSVRPGYTCITSDAPEIIFIDRGEHFIAVLAHEVGHALGLTAPFWGHGDYFEGFYRDAGGRQLNVMVDQVEDNAAPPADQRYFSVGQVARMHLGDASWLNRPSAANGTTLRQRKGMPAASTVLACGCPETANTARCPAVNTDIDRSSSSVTANPPQTTFVMKCGVSAEVPTASVCVDGTITLKATMQPAASPESGAPIWVSLDPKTVKVRNLDRDMTSNVFEAEVTGVRAGTAQVRAWTDGVFAAVDVKVEC